MTNKSFICQMSAIKWAHKNGWRSKKSLYYFGTKGTKNICVNLAMSVVSLIESNRKLRKTILEKKIENDDRRRRVRATRKFLKFKLWWFPHLIGQGILSSSTSKRKRIVLFWQKCLLVDSYTLHCTLYARSSICAIFMDRQKVFSAVN